MRNSRSQHIGNRLRHIHPPHAHNMWQEKGQGKQQKQLAHNSEDKGVPGVAKSYKSVLVDHLEAQHQHGTEHDAHGHCGQRYKGLIACKHMADWTGKGYQAEPHKRGAADAEYPGIVNGFFNPPEVLCAQIIAEDGLCTGDNAD